MYFYTIRCKDSSSAVITRI
ncbi:hypothetical protein VCHC17A1_3863A, partial [Vibrio cholerae HC-17A1]